MQNEYLISDEMRDLIIRYMEACNDGDKVKEEALIQAIKEQGIQDQQNAS
jgi:hypothetical protein